MNKAGTDKTNWLVVYTVGPIFAAVSSAMLAYISMATGVGPWIAPTLVILFQAIFVLSKKKLDPKTIVLTQTAGSVGAIVATGIGFTLPTLFFLNKPEFYNLLSDWKDFTLKLSLLTISAGFLGISLAGIFSEKLIKRDRWNFPVSALIYETIISSSTGKSSVKKLLSGIFTSSVISFLNGTRFLSGKLLDFGKQTIPSLFGSMKSLPIDPTMLAIGFLIGTKTALSLLFGLFINKTVLSSFFSLPIFDNVETRQLINAFCAGLISSELVVLFVRKVGKILSKKSNSSEGKISAYSTSAKKIFESVKKEWHKKILDPYLLYELISGTIIVGFVLRLFKFTILQELFLILATIVATYEINKIGAQLGLIQFGRFATFIMLPMIFIFKLSPTQITILCVFFNIVAATASDLVFDYKVADLAQTNWRKIKKSQIVGLIATAIATPFIFFVLFSSFEIGSPELFARRGLARAFLVLAPSFNYTAVVSGILFGLAIKKLKMSPSLVFGGILMPTKITLELVIGSLFSLIHENQKEAVPFWSGMFTGGSISMLLPIIKKFF